MLLAAAALGVSLLHVLAALRTPLGAASDDALHLLLARNLLAGGYAVPGPGGMPVTDPLPGFPVLLALPTALLAPHWTWLRLAPLLAGALLVIATWRLGRRFLPASAALAAATLVALNPTVVGWAGVVLPDLLFAALALFVLEGLAADGPRPPAWLAPLAMQAALLRPHGALLVLAAAVGVWRRWGPRRAAVFACLALGPLGLWLLRNAVIAGTATAYADHARSVSGLAGLGAHAWRLAGECLGRGVLGLAPGPWAGFAGLAVLAAAASGALSLWRGAKKTERPALLAAFLYMALLAGLHLAWRPWQSRYVFTVLPFVWLFALKAFRKSGLILASIVLIPALSRDFGYAFEGLREPRAELWPRAAAWLRTNTAPGDKVVGLEPYLLALTTGREASFPRPAADRKEWLEGLRRDGVRFVFVRRSGPRAYLSPSAGDLLASFDAWAVKEKPLSPVFSDEGEGVWILERKD